MNQEGQQIRLQLGGTITPIVRILFWANGLSFLFLNLAKWKGNSQAVISLLGLMPSSVVQDGALWQLFTYMFLHLEFWHLVFNMLALWWFGADLERQWGSKSFWRYFVFTGVGAGLTSLFFQVPTIGASGAVYGLLLAYGFLFPNRVLYLYFVIPVRAKYCVLIFAAIEFFALSGVSNVNHLAHIGGMVFGVLWLLANKYLIGPMDLWKKFRRSRMRKKIRLIRKHSDDSDSDPFGNYTNRTIH